MKIKSRTDYHDISGMTAHEMIELMQDYISKYSEFGEIEWTHYHGESPYVEYKSPETEQEKERELKANEFRKERERAEYERLKAKYEDAE